MKFGHQGVVLMPDRVQRSLTDVADGIGIGIGIGSSGPSKQCCHDAHVLVTKVGERDRGRNRCGILDDGRDAHRGGPRLSQRTVTRHAQKCVAHRFMESRWSVSFGKCETLL